MSDTNDKDKNDAHERAKAQFARTAQGYVTSASHAHGEELALLLELAAPVAGRRVLDVATGGGHVALAFARAGALVTALDLTPAMLEAARAFLASRGVAAHFVEGAAEALPFEDASFEVVACRIAAHHFRDPARFVREAARVLVPGGSFLLADNVAPLNAELAAAMNAVERRRDPSHVEAYSAPRWVAFCAEAGLEPTALERFWRVKPYAEWMARAGASAAAITGLEGFVLGLDAAARAYLRVETRSGRLVSLAHEVMLLAARRADLAPRVQTS